MAKPGTQCCAFGCTKRKKRKADGELIIRSDSEGSEDEESSLKRKLPRTFHSFPSNVIRRKDWLAKMHRENWQPSPHSRICSDHFEEQFIDRKEQNVKLKPNAVPTRFKKFPKHLKTVRKTRKPPRNLSPPDTATLQEPEQEAFPPLVRQVPNTDHNAYCLKSPKSLKKELDKSHIKIKLLQRKLKTSKEKTRRLSKKTKSLKAVVKELYKKNYISENCQDQLERALSDVPCAIMKRICSVKHGKGNKYPAELKSFFFNITVLFN